METLKITKENVEQYRNTKLAFEGHIEIEASLGIVGFISVIANGAITAFAGIEAGGSIKAGEGIEAGGSIKAGEGIEAVTTIACSFRISAGLRIWKKTVTDEEKTVTCLRLEGGGTVEYGILIETQKVSTESLEVKEEN